LRASLFKASSEISATSRSLIVGGRLARSMSAPVTSGLSPKRFKALPIAAASIAAPSLAATVATACSTP
jgi:hypothetical protein